jgi:glycosyltransferase involved in cell wall biosynthesis
MQVGIISDSPSVTTGFGVTCYQIVNALAEHGHKVACFGLWAVGETFNRAKYPCKIWPVGLRSGKTSAHLSHFLRHEQPEVLLINADIAAVAHWIDMVRTLGWRGPTVAHFVIDSTPVYGKYLSAISTLQGLLTPTHAAAHYLRSEGIEVQVAPHGVDMKVFRPIEERKDLRRRLGLQDKFVVGVFGRNAERKQHPRVLQALSRVLSDPRGVGTNVYLHCQVRDDPVMNGWDLSEVARLVGVESHVWFPDEAFCQVSGVPYDESLPDRMLARPTAARTFPSDLSYVQRLNCCDLIVNVPFSGGFELTAIEAQACSVPIAVTDDCGAMAEVVGKGAILLQPCDIGVSKTGGGMFHVSPEVIADAIIRLKTDQQLAADLRSRGRANAKLYDWHNLRRSVVSMVELAVGTTTV